MRWALAVAGPWRWAGCFTFFNLLGFILLLAQSGSGPVHVRVNFRVGFRVAWQRLRESSRTEMGFES